MGTLSPSMQVQLVKGAEKHQMHLDFIWASYLSRILRGPANRAKNSMHRVKNSMQSVGKEQLV